jgi:DnaJ-class molecular chaperone
MAENFYTILGVNENASKEEIKKAYRNLQLKYHPDRNGGSNEFITMTHKINEAYEVLSDTKKKQEYDMMLKNPFMRMNSHHGPHGADNIPFNDIINMMFDVNNMFNMQEMMQQGIPGNAKIHIFNGSNNAMPFAQSLNKPLPIMKTLEINIEQVYLGITLPIEVERWILENGIKVYEKEVIYVDIPKGIDENEMIILREKGHIISEQYKGDVKITINVRNTTLFKRVGLDLILDKNITLKEALCGFSFELKCINNKSYTLNNTKGSIVPPEYKKIYPGMGLIRGEHKGNMIIHFHIDFPSILTGEQIDKLSEVL